MVGCGIFIVAWNTRQLSENNYHLFLGIAFLFISILDFTHTIAYSGMNIFQGYDSNLPTQLWIAARFMQSLSLLLSFQFLRRKLNEFVIFPVYFLIASILVISIFLNFFPVCYIEGVGLTLFKIICEYIISLILLAGIVVLLKNRNEFQPQVFKWLLASFVLSIISEILFTFYISVYGLSNLVGHIAKLFAFYMIYKAIIERGMMRPFDSLFNSLSESEQYHVDLNQQLIKTNDRVNAEITMRKELEIELVNISTHDSLTGLYNRRFFDEELARLERGRSFPISIMMIDVDNLKGTNDTFGHASGDKMLQDVSQILLTAFRAGDILARIGGDEFGVLLPNTNSEAVEGALHRVELLLNIYKLEHELKIPISISIGFDTAQKGMSLADTLNRADKNMYRDKGLRI